MIRKIAFKELLTSVLTLRFVIIVLVCCLLVPISVTVLSNDYLSEKTDYDSRVAMEAAREGGHWGRVDVFRPVPQLMALFRGVSVNAVNGIQLHDEPWNQPMSSTVQSPTEAVYPTVDLTFIIGFVMSALAVILAFDSISGEKAAATLRLMMANRVPRSSIVIGKWLGLTIALLLPFLLGIVISLIIFIIMTGAGFTADTWLSLALTVLASVLFLSAYVLLGTVVSAFTSTPTHSIFLGLGVWGLLTILLPQMAVAAADSLVPVPSVKEVEKNIRMATNEYHQATRDANLALAAQAKQEGWEYSVVRQKRRDHEYPRETSFRHHVVETEREYWRKVHQQEQLGRGLAMISPYGSLDQALITLADTGPESQWHFIEEAYEYGLWYFDELVSDPNRPPTDEVIKTMSPFEYKPVSMGDKLGIAAVPFAALCLMNCLLVIVAVIAFNRYDVR
jgi:ABC-type transport system involved in multi-copper enzyme maturation permease subunit